MLGRRARVWAGAALLWAATAQGVQADAGAGGGVPELAQALALREAGDLAAAEQLIDAMHAVPGGRAAQWEAALARAELAAVSGDFVAVEAAGPDLLAEAEAIFGPGTGRMAPMLVALAEARAGAGAGEEATGLLLRATRLARAAYSAGQGPDGAPPDAQRQADLFASLAALADHLLANGEGRAAALLAAELGILGSDPPEGLPPRWQDAAALGALAELRAGRPVEALVRATPLLGLEEDPATLRARRLTEAFLTEIDALAVASGDPEAAIDEWIAKADEAHLRIAAMDDRFMTGMQPVMAALGAGDAVAADAAARVALADVRADDPLVTTAYLALLGTTLNAGRPDLAETWAIRIAEMPPAYLASLDADPLPLLADLAEELRSGGSYPGAIAVGEAVALVAPLRAQAGQEDRTVAALIALATTLTDAGQTRQAGELFDQALALMERDGAGSAEAAVLALVGRARLALDLGDAGDAVADLGAARALLQQTDEGQRPDAWLFVSTALRDAHLVRGDRAAALAVLREAADRVSALEDGSSAAAAEAWFALAQLLQAGDEDAAEPVARAADAAAGLPKDDPLKLRIGVLQAAAQFGDGTLVADLAQGGAEAALALAEAASAAAQSGDQGQAVAFLDSAIAALDEAAPTRAYFEAAKGELLWRGGDAVAALPALRAATRALTRADRRGEPKARDHLPAHVAAALTLAEAAEGVAGLNAFTEAFQVAQRVNDLSAGAALGRATARLLGSGPEAEALARAFDSGTRAEAAARETYLAHLAEGADVTAARQALGAAQASLDDVRAQIATSFPDYAGLADPRPVDLLATARLLGPEEVLLLYASAPGDDPASAPGHVFAITAEGYLAAPLPPRADLARIAQALRCEAALTDPRCGLGGGGTRGAFSLAGPVTSADPAFDFALARAAWDALFAPVAVALEGKSSLIVVPDRTLSAMPFHLALTDEPGPATTLATAPWLLRRMAVTVVPSVSSFAALRNRALRGSGAELPFLGIGDPLIGVQAAGPVPYACGEGAEGPLLAAPLLPATGPILRAGAAPGGEEADPVALASLPALPDTRCELERNAELLGQGSRILLQGEATERRVKALSDSGELARYRILSFATHGLIAGEVGAANAGLVLTPPAQADSADDGLLTVAEIAGLRIDADFVILSACNTASGSSQVSEGLAGLASAFFLAGARGVLVSHWPVYSDAATRLTTGMAAALAAPGGTGRAEALRQSVLTILDDPAATPRELHPAYWAPFLVVGDGRAGQG